ncbi:histidine kinase [Chlorella sorokiniana]|uniref:Histidine kinase n=1 Tax=Chlorella sorokiniana TaxID=3076 RepID=A0A2P6TG70_CHLSO|nr:histidine kinase [Chlorella sorokiniana]|eukprot:PRW33127.1 histidine kinase [Chlorella sorokiniana]
MDAMVKELNVAADKRTSDEDLGNLNSGLKAVIDRYSEECGAMNEVVDMFAKKDNLDNFNRFEKSYDTKSILALAKLDGTRGTNGALVNFAREMASKLQIRKSCLTPAKVVESKCSAVRSHLKQCGEYSGECTPPRQPGRCYGTWDRCVSDLDKPSWSLLFVGPWKDLQKGQGKVNQARCPDVGPSVTAAIREQGISLAADITKELKDVKDIIGTLRDIANSGGMPRESFGILRKQQYPQYGGACSNNIARSAPASQRSSEGVRCGRNCASCQPSWRCLQCKPGFRLDAGGATCSK